MLFLAFFLVLNMSSDKKKLNRTYNSTYLKKELEYIPEMVSKSKELLGNGYSVEESISYLVNNHSLSSYQARTVVSSVWDTITSIDGDECLDVYKIVKIGLMDLLKKTNDFYIAAESKSDQADALRMKLKVLSQLRDLIPRQYQIHSVVEDIDDTKRLLFDIHGITEDVLEGD